MLQKTNGIVLHTIDYTDNSLIAKIYTEQFGLQSYIINGINKKGNSKSALLQPLTQLNIVAYKKQNAQLGQIKEFQLAHAYEQIPIDITKRTIALFIAEVLYKSLKEEEYNPALYNFLSNSLNILDLQENKIVNFHVLFLMQFTKYLGFFPSNNFSNEEPFFDLAEGIYRSTEPHHPYFTNPQTSKLIFNFSNVGYSNLDSIHLSGIERKTLLNSLITYYELHLHGGNKLQSHLILEEVLAG